MLLVKRCLKFDSGAAVRYKAPLNPWRILNSTELKCLHPQNRSFSWPLSFSCSPSPLPVWMSLFPPLYLQQLSRSLPRSCHFLLSRIDGLTGSEQRREINSFSIHWTTWSKSQESHPTFESVLTVKIIQILATRSRLDTPQYTYFLQLTSKIASLPKIYFPPSPPQFLIQKQPTSPLEMVSTRQPSSSHQVSCFPTI